MHEIVGISRQSQAGDSAPRAPSRPPACPNEEQAAALVESLQQILIPMSKDNRRSSPEYAHLMAQFKRLSGELHKIRLNAIATTPLARRPSLPYTRPRASVGGAFLQGIKQRAGTAAALKPLPVVNITFSPSLPLDEPDLVVIPSSGSARLTQPASEATGLKEIGNVPIPMQS